uniref:Uncharacterized protein n=1 Tax=Electrophorus electricus TaxID=8005 RepID=A0A4W4GMV1_ELEEL
MKAWKASYLHGRSSLCPTTTYSSEPLTPRKDSRMKGMYVPAHVRSSDTCVGSVDGFGICFHFHGRFWKGEEH